LRPGRKLAKGLKAKARTGGQSTKNSENANWIGVYREVNVNGGGKKTRRGKRREQGGISANILDGVAKKFEGTRNFIFNPRLISEAQQVEA